MNSRYLTNIGLALLGGVIVVVSQAWSPSVFMWVMLGAGAAALALAGSIALRGRGRAQRALDAILGILGAWTIVASLVFGGTVVTWLGFASGVAFVALAVIGLTLHELYTERVVHSFEVRTPAAEHELAGAR
jgi:hypothetical protein